MRSGMQVESTCLRKMERLVLAAALLCLPLAGSEDLFWRPNTDWGNPSNWKLGRAPCEGDVADLSSVPLGSVLQLDGEAKVRSVLLPVGSTIVLGKTLNLKLSNSTSCQISTANGPMVAPVKEDNVFVGARPSYWECPENWETSDGTTAKSAPCGKDRAFFREGHYYWSVQSNQSKVAVQYLNVRGELVTTELIPKVAPEFKLNLVVDSQCGEDPSLCPCFPTMCKPLPSAVPSLAGSKRDDNRGTVAAVAVVFILVLLLAVVAVVLVVCYRWRRSHYYKKDEPLGEPDDSLHSPTLHSPTARAVAAGEGVLFDNPIYQANEGGVEGNKKDKNSPDKSLTRTHEIETMAILRPSKHHYEQVDFNMETKTSAFLSNKAPVLEDYEPL